MKSYKADKFLFDKLEKCIWRKEILKIHFNLAVQYGLYSMP